MALYEWKDSYKVGNDFIDFDHKTMFRMIDDFHTALHQDTAQYELEKLLVSLAEYAQKHFKREEDEMTRLDANGFLLHKLEHKKFLLNISTWQERYAKGEFMFTIEVSRFLFGWLKHHILKTDQLLADAIQMSYPSIFPDEDTMIERQVDVMLEIAAPPKVSQ
jgi:hemerythrin